MDPAQLGQLDWMVRITCRPAASGALAAALARLDPATLDDEGFDQLLVLAGLAGAGGMALPERMAPVNALLDAAPTRVREALLRGFLDRVSRPPRMTG